MDSINALLDQVSNLKTGPLLVIAVLVTGYLIKAVPKISNGFIPLITCAVAVAGNIMLGDPGSVSPSVRYPDVQLGLAGLAFWGVGWLIHNQGLSRLEKLLPPGLKNLLGIEDKPTEPKP